MNTQCTLRLVRRETLPALEWQKHAVFPDWKGYTDDTLAMNSMLGFRFWHGQGSLWLKVSPETRGFACYVNGCRADTSAVTEGIWELDLSGAAVDGMNALQISGIRPRGRGGAVEVFIPYPMVLPGDSLEGIRPETLKMISGIIASDTAYGFPGAQLAVVRNGRLVYEGAWGYVNRYDPDGSLREDGPGITNRTLFDLASVTKMFSANYAVQKLVTDGLLDIDMPLVGILGDAFAEDTLDIVYTDAKEQPDHETQKAWKRSLTVRDLLRHQAGFPSSPDYNNPDYDMARQVIGEKGSNRCYAPCRERMLPAICFTPLLYRPGTATLYSDVDYILLTFVIEAVTHQRLDRYMEENFYTPLGLRHITFLPTEHGFQPEDCAATELRGNTRDGHIFFPGVRTDTVQGQVQDERAWYCMQGVSGHAGLFANAADLARLASVMLTGGYGGKRFFSRDVLDGFTAPKSFGMSQWGLGWWRGGDDARVWYFGTQASSGTVGHQGWTGTLVMIDPARELVIAYLTHKINSPVTGPENLNAFDGGCYTAATLGFVPQLLSVGMDGGEDVSGQLLDLMADMAAGSVRLIPPGAPHTHARVRNAQSKIAVLRSMARAAGHDGYLALADELEADLSQRG